MSEAGQEELENWTWAVESLCEGGSDIDCCFHGVIPLLQYLLF